MKIRTEDALEYHKRSPKGKIEVNATKPVSTHRDLSLAYSPGVAEPCKVIAENVEAPRPSNRPSAAATSKTSRRPRLLKSSAV